MLPVILPVGDLSGACGWDGSEWRRIKVTTGGELVLQTYGIVFDWTATSDVTYVDVTGLDINSHRGYWIYITRYNPTTSTSRLDMCINGDYILTNYYHHYLVAYDTTISGNKENNPGIGVALGGEREINVTFLTLAPGGIPYAVSWEALRPGTNIYQLFSCWVYVSSVSNITSLRIAGSVSNSIGAGSTILIYRLK
jgi:hypothetical protein